MPHPILKIQQSPSNPFPFASHPVLDTPHVHFPPTPSLTSTYCADSPSAYDRAPIVVAPNLCELPKRGDRVLTSRTRRIKAPNDYFHPRAYETCRGETFDPFHPPPMIPDLSSSSESDESDGFACSSEYHYPPSITIESNNVPHSPLPQSRSQGDLDNALSFLPHPPSSVKDKARRSWSPGRPRAREFGYKTPSAFAAPSLDDGCLGGF